MAAKQAAIVRVAEKERNLIAWSVVPFAYFLGADNQDHLEAFASAELADPG